MPESAEQKIDRILLLLEGEPAAPGIISRLNSMEHIIYGRDQTLGLRSKVLIMWRVHIWLLCTSSAACGFLLEYFLTRIH